MFLRTEGRYLLTMATSLALLGVLRALTIDTQLTVIKNDCYERLAIGQRLSPKDVYKTSNANTVLDCQLACTQEKELCKSFSFGIGVKGNATCELSVDLVKETADLKPIGTKADPEFDLYIKKIGCTLIIDPNDPAFNTPRPPPAQEKPEKPPSYDKPPPSSGYDKPPSPPTNGYGKPPPPPTSGYDKQPPPSTNGYDKPPPPPTNGYDKPPPPPTNGYGPSTTKPVHNKPQYDGVEHVQTLVSISTGPQKPVLHPVHEILVGDGPYNYARPPFRPPALNHPYDRPVYKPRPDYYGSRFEYLPRPDYDSRPNLDRYDSRPGSSYLVPYGPRPLPEKYGSYIPRPEDYYNRPKPDDYYKPRPDKDYYKPRPNDDYSHRPNPFGDYMQRPGGGYRPSDDYSHRPNPPSDYPHRPQRPSDGYGDRPNPPNDYPHRPSRPSDGYGDRPKPPSDYHHRPSRPSDDYGDRPNRPSDYPHRPSRPSDDYVDRPNPPSDYNHRPLRPGDHYEDRPNPPSDYNHKPPKPSDHYGDRPNPPSDYNHKPPKPSDHYGNRPNPPSDYNHRPSRPNDDFRPNPPSDYNHIPPSSHYGDRPNPPSDYNHRPLKPSDDYGNRPNPSNDYPHTPSKPSGGYGDRPNSPSDYPHRPPRPNDDYGNRPNHPSDYNHRPLKPSDGYGDRPNPPSDYNHRPLRPSDDYGHRPNPPNDYQRPKPSSDIYIHRPTLPNDYNERPPSDNYVSRPNTPSDDYGQKAKPKPPSDYGGKPSKPTNEYLFNEEVDRYDPGPSKPDDGYSKPGSNKPSNPDNPNGGGYGNSIDGGSKPKEPHSKPIVTQSVGPHGETITSIITELEEACFRRVLAGKRVTRALVKRALFCERVEDCQLECADEKRFVCEGFNYRLDPTGRGKGECELLDIPLSHLDIGRDLYPDPDYDYYERDRNAASANCKGHGYYPQRPQGWGHRRPRPDYYDEYDDRPGGNRRGDFAYHSHHSDHSYHHHTDHGPPPYDYGSYEPYLPPNRRPYEDKYHDDREKDKNYWFSKPSWGSYGGSYGTSYDPNDFDRKNYYLPPKVGGTKDWGQYGGSYGNGGVDLHYNGFGLSHFDIWGFNKFEEKFHNYGELPPYKDYPPDRPHYPSKPGGSYLPEPPKPSPGGGYLPEPPKRPIGGYLPEPPKPPSGGYLPEPPKPPSGGYLPEPPKPPSGGYLPEPPSRPIGGYLPDHDFRPPVKPGYLPDRRPPFPGGSYLPVPERPDDYYHNSVLPAEPRYPYHYDFLKDECSLRSATGFKLHKGIVKKFFAVPSIYECELLCFKEKDFPCASYAFRYTVSLTSPTDNCYLSDRNYKQLDFYTDLQPDRDFDIYTMNNQQRCEQPIVHGKENSECFWRVRSAQRLDTKVVRDSLTVKSIVECQIECLKAVRFTCRAFSFRYGSPVIGGAIDNCQLTDWPFFELDPRIHLVPEPGYELYERGSFGHGCEPDHFGIRGKPWKAPGTRVDQLCYIGFGKPARLLREATRKEVHVLSEEECKAECSKLRQNTLFQCMSFSYSNNAKWGPNCKLSDILQRDLLPDVDYVPDPDSWLFAWDNYNPECRAIVNDPVHNHIGPKDGGIRNRHDYDLFNALATWRVYSVSGWPCRRGTLCQENREAGFWFCELEGGDSNAWDYCCRPDHQCGYSQGFAYQWCYVGPARTQWRKCSDRYYPYVHHYIDRFDRRPPPRRPGLRPDRPPAPPARPPPRPSLDEYEAEFEMQFLDPPKPGGFGQPRHWPLSYLHKEMPPNNTDSEPRLMKSAKNPKFAAIQNLIDVIKSNDLKNIQYQITNESNKEDDILFVKIPLPTNFTQEAVKRSEKMTTNTTISVSGPVDLVAETNSTNRSQKSLTRSQLSLEKMAPVYKRGYVERTNVTTSQKAKSSKTL